MRQKKKLAIFDIDGTIFRSSLLIELTEKLVAYGVFPRVARVHMERTRELWRNRQGTYEEYLQSVIRTYSERLRGVMHRDVKRIARLVIHEQKRRVYVYTRDLLQRLRPTHRLLAISGSPSEIVQEFKRVWHFDDVFGTVYEKKGGIYTGKVLSVASQKKKEILKAFCRKEQLSLTTSLGVGDTESDIAFLSEVRHAIAFNPNRKLLTTARRRGWKVVVERKDVIYTL